MELKLKVLKIVDRVLSRIVIVQKQLHNYVNEYRCELHKRIRFKERYGVEYTREIENKLIQYITDSRNNAFLKTYYGGNIFKIKYKKFIVYAVYDKHHKKIRTFLTKAQVESDIEKELAFSNFRTRSKK